MMNKTVEEREVTMKELVEAFEGKYVNVSSTDSYGISIEMRRGTVEYEEEDGIPELFLVSRDSENRVTGSMCFEEDSIESIVEYDGTYTVNFTLYMSRIEIEEYKTPEQLEQEFDERQKENALMKQVVKPFKLIL